MADIIQFILINALMVSAGVILVLVARTLPRVHGEAPAQMSMIERFVTSEIPEKLDVALNNFSSKFLRKLRVWVLKLDNAIHRQLSKIKLQKEETANGTGKLFENAVATETPKSLFREDFPGMEEVPAEEKQDTNHLN